MRTKKVIGFCGSLRRGSLNMLALRLAGELMPETMRLSVANIKEIPMFDADLLGQGIPESVRSLRAQIEEADAVLIASPEYNFSVPGVLKNTLDWISRTDDQPFALKPVAILSATAGPVGGARMQYDLRKIMLSMNAQVLVKPEVFIGSAPSKFKDENCVDDATRKFVSAQMTALHDWINMVHRMQGF